MDYIIETNELTKKFGSRAVVNKVSLHIKSGDIYGFIGKNGAGKTTAMKLILGLIHPTSGSIKLFGSNNLANQRIKIGSLIEEPAFYRNVTAYENLKRFSILYGAGENEIVEILELVGLKDDMRSKKVSQFSLGMKQRLAIAISLLGNPQILILDEPVNGLDPAGIKEVRDLILKLNRDKGVTFFISSHLLDELSKIATTYGIINDGNLVEEVGASELVEKFRHSLRIKVSDVDKAINVLNRYSLLGQFDRGENSLSLYSNLDRSADINEVLIKSGVRVKEIQVCTSDFEDYFIRKIGG